MYYLVDIFQRVIGIYYIRELVNELFNPKLLES
jgi:hypothetical protein